MTYEEVTPHLNKIVRLNLKNTKRKVGWLFVDFYHEVSSDPLKEVHCVNVINGKKLCQGGTAVDMKSVKRLSEIIQIEDIFKIHSPK